MSFILRDLWPGTAPHTPVAAVAGGDRVVAAVAQRWEFSPSLLPAPVLIYWLVSPFLR